MNMINTRPTGPVFREGDEVVLAEGTHQGTLGVFVRLNSDNNWATITEHGGGVRSHPVAWLAHATAETDQRSVLRRNR